MYKLIAALTKIVGSRFDRYIGMFEKYIKDEKGFRDHRERIENLIKWAIKTFKREDRVIWILRKYRDGLKNPKNPEKRSLDANMDNLRHLVANAEVHKYQSVLDYKFPIDATVEQVVNDLRNLEAIEAEKVGDEERSLISLKDYEDEDIDVSDFINFGDGWVWHLIDAPACELEADSMTHCGNKDSSRPDDTILSLRKEIKVPENSTKYPTYAAGIYYKPYATFILNDGILGERKGVMNNKPGKNIYKYIVPLMLDDRIKGIGREGYLPENNFHISDLPQDKAEEILSKKPELGGLLYYYKRKGPDNYFMDALENEYDLEVDKTKKQVVIATYKNIFEFSQDIPELDKALDAAEDGFDKIYIDSTDTEWVINTFKDKYPEAFEAIVGDIRKENEEEEEEEEEEEDRVSDDALFSEEYGAEISGAYIDASVYSYERVLHKSIEEYLDSDYEDGFTLDTKTWDDEIHIVLDLNLSSNTEEFLEMMEKYGDYDVAELNHPTYRWPDWRGMDYDAQDENTMLELLVEKLVENLPEKYYAKFFKKQTAQPDTKEEEDRV